MIPSWLGHLIEAVFISSFVYLVTVLWLFDVEAAIAGIMFSIGHFHGREKRDVENMCGMAPPHLKAYWFGCWHYKSLLDFVPVLCVGLGVVYWITR